MNEKQAQNDLRQRFNRAYDKYKVAGVLGSHTLEELQTLIAGECWMDGADFKIAVQTSEAYQNTESARHYLRMAFNYEEGCK